MLAAGKRLALVTLWQHGTAECDWEPYSYGGGYGSGWSDDDGGGAGDEYEMGEIFDTSLWADHWSDRQGKKFSSAGYVWTNHKLLPMLAIDARLPLSRLIDHALRIPKKYTLTVTHLAAIFTLEPRLGMLTVHNTVISHWLASCRQMLQARTAVVPQEPADFRRANKLSCSCTHCSECQQQHGMDDIFHFLYPLILTHPTYKTLPKLSS